MTKKGMFGRILAAAVGVLQLAAPAANAAEMTALPGIAMSMRMSPSQYKAVIADLFGPAIRITGRFEPEVRAEGLLAVGARTANVSSAGLERYDELARGVAAQVVDVRHRDTLIPCKPKSVTAPDDACARVFFSKVGALMYRTPLEGAELEGTVQSAGRAATMLNDFYGGVSATLATMLVSPRFLYRYRMTEPDPAKPDEMRLDGPSKAAALSFFLWNTTPDPMLLQTAESGELHTAEGLKRQVDRMTSSPRIEAGLRAFFADMLAFSQFETVAKDPLFFPRYTLVVKEQSQEQTLRTIVDHVLVKRGDYRDLFTTPHTFLTTSLAPVYGVPLVDHADNGQPERWVPYTYPEGDPRSGILAHASFVALHSPAGRSSPTLRGKALRENILCQMVPPPPGDVDFTVVSETTSQVYKTGRERLLAHSSEPVCAGCHKITDPIGLALENFDSGGGFRTTENGAPIDTSGVLSGVKFQGPSDLAKVIRNDPAVPACVAKRAFAFGSGQAPPRGDEWAQVERKFAESGFDVLELFRQVAMSDLFFRLPSTQAATN